MQLIGILITPAPSVGAPVLSSCYVDPGQEPPAVEFAYQTPLEALRDGWRLLDSPKSDGRNVTWWLVRDALILLPADPDTAAIRWDEAIRNMTARPEPPQAKIIPLSPPPSAHPSGLSVWTWDQAPEEYRAALPLSGVLVAFVPEGRPVPRFLTQWDQQSYGSVSGGTVYSYGDPSETEDPETDDTQTSTVIWAWDEAPEAYRSALAKRGVFLLVVPDGQPIPDMLAPYTQLEKAPVPGGAVYSYGDID